MGVKFWIIVQLASEYGNIGKRTGYPKINLQNK